MSIVSVNVANSFDEWRVAARSLLAANIEPGRVVWNGEGQGSLFGDVPAVAEDNDQFAVPAEFIKLAKAAACFASDDRWPVLYRLLYRLKHETRMLLEIESDADVRRARSMEKAVNRDVHKFHAFVRFRMVETEGGDIYVAWHEPAHFTVERATPLFERRFGSMRFSILTPKGCAHWDKRKLTFSAPALKSHAPAGDETEEFWLLYYRSIFNPFRLKVNAMKKELPVRHWPTLPEAVLIPELIAEARKI